MKKIVNYLATWIYSIYIVNKLKQYEELVKKSSLKFDYLVGINPNDAKKLATLSDNSFRLLALSLNSKISENAIITAKKILENDGSKNKDQKKVS